MRLLPTLALCLAATPAAAGCRLSATECGTLLHEMAVEEAAAAADERRYRPGDLSRFDRAAALGRRHLDRIDERGMRLPTRIADEWLRLETCAASDGGSGPGCR